MSKKVYGVYRSSEEMINAVTELKGKGYNLQQMTVVAKSIVPFKDNNQLAGIKLVNTDYKEDPLFDKMVHVFVSDPQDTPAGRLMGEDVLMEDAEVYGEEIEKGKIVLLVD
jgi:hypothetical protein